MLWVPFPVLNIVISAPLAAMATLSCTWAASATWLSVLPSVQRAFRHSFRPEPFPSPGSNCWLTHGTCFHIKKNLLALWCISRMIFFFDYLNINEVIRDDLDDFFQHLAFKFIVIHPKFFCWKDIFRVHSNISLILSHSALCIFVCK